MRYLQIRLSGEDAALHSLAPTLTDPDVFEEARMIEWEPTYDPPRATVLLYLEGNLTYFEDVLTETDIVLEYDITQFDDTRGYAYIHSEAHPTEWKLATSLSGDGLLPVFPIEYYHDGTISVRVLGSPERLQAAVEQIPEGIETTIEQVGEYDLGQPPIPPGLPPRQREALQTAFELGYYDVPRSTSREDVADQLACAPSTVSEHLRKAERELVRTYLHHQSHDAE